MESPGPALCRSGTPSSRRDRHRRTVNASPERTSSPARAPSSRSRYSATTLAMLSIPRALQRERSDNLRFGVGMLHGCHLGPVADAGSEVGRRAAKTAAAERALSVLLEAERLVALADPAVSAATLALLLGLKRGPLRPEQLAVLLGLQAPVVRQRLLRARRSKRSSVLLSRRTDGLYELTLRGHRFVNTTAGLAYHLLALGEGVSAVTAASLRR